MNSPSPIRFLKYGPSEERRGGKDKIGSPLEIKIRIIVGTKIKKGIIGKS